LFCYLTTYLGSLGYKGLILFVDVLLLTLVSKLAILFVATLLLTLAAWAQKDQSFFAALILTLAP